jgi:hypothetical protein
MAHSATLHVKIDPGTDTYLKHLAARRHTSKGQLIREAISACYQTSLTEMPLHQRQALAAYQGGFISISRLARVMGMHVLELRHWLQEHDTAQNSSYSEQDVNNA